MLKNRNSAPNLEWFWPLIPIKAVLSEPLFVGLVCGIFGALVLPILYPLSRLFRVVGAVGTLLGVAMAHPNDIIGNSSLLWPAIAILLAWPDLENVAHVKRNLFIAQSYVLSVYFCSGLWKLRLLVAELLYGDFSATLMGSVPQGVSIGLAEGTANTSVLLQWTNRFPYLGAVLWLMVIAFQLSTVAGIFWPRTLRSFGLGIILFHVSAGIFLGPNFALQVFAIAYLFFIAPLLVSVESRG